MKLPIVEALAARSVDYCLAPSNNNSLTDSSYHEIYRPQVHFSISEGFQNDPNGLIYNPYDQTYHLSFQYNPYQLKAANQHWGHAVSDDLINWKNYQPAIVPPSENLTVLSGSSVIDDTNTSGLFNDSVPAGNRFVALYTELDKRDSDNLWQRQRLAYSSDGGFNYELYPEPVLDIGQKEFRDPKVFKHNDGRWIMSIVLASQYKVVWYQSENLFEWSYLNEFGLAGYPAYQYECPDIFPLPVENEEGVSKHVILTSIQPGAPKGGSTAQYFVGDLDEKEFTFTPQDNLTRLLSFGLDDYATISFENLPEGHPRTIVGWQSNWAYTSDTPLPGYRGGISLPRELSLVKANTTSQFSAYYLKQNPIDLSSIHGDKVFNTNEVTKNGSVDLVGDAFDVEFNINGSSSGLYDSSEKPFFEIRIENADGSDWVTIGIQYDIHTIYVNRAHTSGFEADNFVNYAGETFMPPTDGKFKLRFILDRTTLEIYAQDGLYYASNIFFMNDKDGNPDLPARLTYSATDSVNATSVDVQALNSIYNLPICDEI